jgi:hypothetical protein
MKGISLIHTCHMRTGWHCQPVLCCFYKELLFAICYFAGRVVGREAPVLLHLRYRFPVMSECILNSGISGRYRDVVY